VSGQWPLHQWRVHRYRYYRGHLAVTGRQAVLRPAPLFRHGADTLLGVTCRHRRYLISRRRWLIYRYTDGCDLHRGHSVCSQCCTLTAPQNCLCFRLLQNAKEDPVKFVSDEVRSSHREADAPHSRFCTHSPSPFCAVRRRERPSAHGGFVLRSMTAMGTK